MPTTQGAINNLDGTVWQKGYLYGQRVGGVVDAIGFGALQNIRLSNSYEFAELSGSESLSPVAVGTRGQNLSGSFECGVLTPEQLFMAIGGQLTVGGTPTRTTYRKLVNEEPKAFNLRYVSEDGSDPAVECWIYNCLAPDWNIVNGDTRAWMLGGGSFRAYGQSQADGGKLFEWSKPGSLVNAS